MFLATIPNEVLVNILSGLHGADLASISQVSRHLNALAEPILYKVVSLTQRLPVPSPMRIFLRTIVVRPELAQLVQGLILKWDEVLDFDPDPDGPDITLFTSVAKSVGIQSMIASPDIQAHLILYLLPNLRRLEAKVPKDSMDEFMSGNAGHRLKSLLELDLHWIDSDNGLSPTAFFAACLLPSLLKLTVHDVGYLGEIESWCDSSHLRASLVTHMSFGSGGGVCTRSLQLVLELPRALTHLSFHSGRGDEDGWLNGRALGEAIRALRDTLVYLRVEIRSGGVCSAISSLRGMTVLSSVWCPLSVLLHEKGPDESLGDALPAAIVRFVTESDQYFTPQEVRGQIGRLVDAKERYGLDHLEEVMLMDGGVSERISAVSEGGGVVSLSV